MDFYVLLGVEREATTGDLKRAYRRLARKYHPDINPGDRAAEAFFRRLVEAYETLSDPDRRRHYDRGGGSAGAAEPATYEFQGFDFSAVADGSLASTFGELFAEVFRPPATNREERPARGADLHSTVAISFDEAMRGVERHLSLTRLELCPACGGAGALRSSESRCGQCQGSGSQRSARGHMVFSRPCRHCGGTGEQRSRTCRPCGGEGLTPRAETVTLSIPVGVADGGRVRVPGKGNMGRHGGAAGDLYVSVHVAPHRLFKRHGDDLLAVVPVAVHEAALGARIDVPSIDGGPARVRVVPGTQSGQRFRLTGRGAPAPDGRRGDLIVEVRLVLPRLIDERSKELLREFGRINQEDVRKDLRAW